MSGAFERALGGFALLVLVFLSFPTLIIVPMSFGTDPYLRFPPHGFSLQWYAAYFADPDWIGATVFSVKVASLVAVCAVVLGTLAALALRAGVRGGRWLRLVLAGPLILPQIVIAVALLQFWERLRMVGSIPAFVAAHTCLALPYVIFTVSGALARYDTSLDAAAMMCGAGRATVIRRITLPLLRPALISGALFAFLISFDEPVVSFFLASLTDKPLARKFFEDIQLNVSPTLAAVATMLTLIVLCAVAVLRRDAA